VIRDYDASRDAAALRACFVELQEFERTLEPNAPPGEAIADEYLRVMFARCATWAGRVFVAEVDGALAGFVSVWGRVPPQDPDEPRAEYAYVCDLVVRAPFRRRGIARALMERAEAYAREVGSDTIGVGVSAGNPRAPALYASLGYRPVHIELRKSLA
jgi:GNAT superfamily N-acetyltransferase